MADNFNLRSFLTENKLTKNAQLLKEEVSLNGKPVNIRSIEIDGIDTSDYPDFVDAYIVAADYEDGTPLTDDELQELEDQNYGIVGELIHDRQLYLEEGTEEEINEAINYDNLTSHSLKDLESLLDIKKTEREKLSSKEPILPMIQGMINNLGVEIGKIQREINSKKKEAVKENKMTTKQAQHLKKGDIITSGDEIISVSAGAKTPAGKVEVTMKTKSGSTKTSTWGKTTMIGVKPKETVKENTMTNRERRLVEMVNNAMGFSEGEENVDYTMGRQDDPNQLPNPAPELNIPEGDESIEEAKPLPKYNSIEELMKEIEHGTNEAACKYKMEEMKRIYEALEAKVGSLEEGENAEHIDQKKVKQMRKDIAALRKAEERLRKDFDKKFNKEKKEAPKKEKEVVALQEGTFDLRKFLIENRK